MDEFKADCGEWNPVTHKWDTVRFLTNVTDGDSHRVIDVLDATSQQNLSKYFHKYGSYERRKVQYFCCDMSGSYISLAKNSFPNAIICIDMFHVVNRLNDAVDNVRRRLQKKTRDAGEEQAYSDLKHLSRILKTRRDRQDDLWKDHAPLYRQRLETAFCSFPELRESYEMLQDFHIIAASGSPDEKQEMLETWLMRYTVSLVKEVSDAANTIDRYRMYILNSWKYNLSNGPCEGINNRIKALKRVSFGFHHYKYFRKRILLTCGNTKPEIASYTIYNRNANEQKEGTRHDT